MSSAILYVAIVVIWACVLIPRWLRRDSSATASVAALTAETEEETGADPAAEEEPAPSPRRQPSEGPPSRERRAARVPDEADADLVDPAHRRVLSARRRLLLMLVVLSIAAGGLAGTRTAAR